MTAERGRANRRRGAVAERAVVNYLRANGWPDARRYLAGDGRQPGDIDWHPLICLEVKDVASSAWPSWCRQAAAAAPAGTVPVVVRRTRGVPDVGLWECRVHVGWMAAHLDAYPDAWTDDVRLVDGCQWVLWTFVALVALVRAVDATTEATA